MKNIQRTFSGFSTNTLKFLEENSAQNSKQWFEAHRQDYERYVLEPMKNLVTDVSEFMLTVDPYLEISPKVNKTISKIYRDTRFSKNKSLFKNNMWITFKRPVTDWKDTPVYFFEIFPDWYRYGMGFYSASKTTMDTFRKGLDENPDNFIKAIAPFSNQNLFTLVGEKYKKIINTGNPDIIQDWYQRKNFYLVCNRNIDDTLFSKKLVDDLIFGFGLLAPFYQYLWQILFSDRY